MARNLRTNDDSIRRTNDTTLNKLQWILKGIYDQNGQTKNALLKAARLDHSSRLSYPFLSCFPAEPKSVSLNTTKVYFLT
jgi:hypothetical protein